jgi:4-hydroxythreonine-4-phosphate dehydrogenase
VAESATIALACGDPAGVGPEVIAAWLAAHPREAADAAVIGPARWLSGLGSGARKIPVGLDDFAAEPGRPTAEGSLVAWAALERAAEGCRSGEFAGAVTGPVSKEGMARIGWPFPGQTEFFAARWGGEPTMAFQGTLMRVALLTWHIPLREVPSHLTPGGFERTVRAAVELAETSSSAEPSKDGRRPPVRVAVCGLNPHAGEAGLFGSEERDIIDPILDALRARFPGLSRTLPADTAFARQLRGEFDVVVALYHDQGLGPLKTVDFDTAVNATLGLPFVRTSPDHGTAFGIAGTGRANPASFANAVAVARRLIKSRSGA